MGQKTKNIVTIVLLLAVLFGFSVWSLAKPDAQRSVAERRALAQFPEVSAATLWSGTFMDQFESYTLDQFPLRDELRGVKALTALKLLRQKDYNGLYVEGGSAAKLDYPLHTDSVDNAAERFQRVRELCLQDAGQIYLAIVPDKNYYTDASYPKMDYEALSERLCAAMPYAAKIDLTDALDLTSYYHSDPHWRQEALLPAAERLAQAMGTQLGTTYETVTLDTPFRGSYTGQYPLRLAADSFCYLTNETIEALQVYDYEKDAQTTVYDLSAADGEDPYALFLSGSRALLTIENPNAATDRRLVLFRDSYGSSIAPLLAQGYAQVTLIDIRYIAPELLGRFVDFTDCDVLFLYSATVLNSSNTLR